MATKMPSATKRFVLAPEGPRAALPQPALPPPAALPVSLLTISESKFANNAYISKGFNSVCSSKLITRITFLAGRSKRAHGVREAINVLNCWMALVPGSSLATNPGNWHAANAAERAAGETRERRDMIGAPEMTPSRLLGRSAAADRSLALCAAFDIGMLPPLLRTTLLPW